MNTLSLGRDRTASLRQLARLSAMVAVLVIPLIDFTGTASAGVFTLSFVVLAGSMLLLRQGFNLFDALPCIVPLTFLVISPASDDPLLSARFSILLMMTLVMPTLLRTQLSRQDFLLLTALVLMGTIPIHVAVSPSWGAMQGLFGSKNFFALRAGITLVFSLWVVLNREFVPWFRLIGLVAAALSIFGLARANSAGAVITCGMASVVFLVILGSSRMSVLYRHVFYAYALVLIVVGGGLLVAYSDTVIDTVLTAFSKDAGLTGRDYLWARAFQYIRENPVTGSGYGAFWVQGNVEAEGLWRALYIATRSGFHFHNLYINTTVETGFVGLTVVCTTLLIVTIRVVSTSLGRPDDFAAVSLALLSMFLMRTYVEVDFPFSFNYFTFLIAVLWAFRNPDPEGEPDEAEDEAVAEAYPR